MTTPISTPASMLNKMVLNEPWRWVGIQTGFFNQFGMRLSDDIIFSVGL